MSENRLKVMVSATNHNSRNAAQVMIQKDSKFVKRDMIHLPVLLAPRDMTPVPSAGRRTQVSKYSNLRSTFWRPMLATSQL